MFATSAGIVWVGFWPGLIAWFPMLFLVLGVFGLARSLAPCFPAVAKVLLILGFFFSGVCWHLVRAEQRLDQRIPEFLEGQDLLVQGHVASIPQQRSTGQRFQFAVESNEGVFRQGRVLLNSYGQLQFKAGQRWQLVVRLQRPHGSANPGTFDYESWLFQQGIAARGYIRSSDDNRQLPGTDPSLTTFRARIRERLLVATEGLPYQSVLLALTLGDRNLLTDEQWELFTRTGTNHLVVISGLHVVLVATLCGLCVSSCWRFNCRLMTVLPAQQAGALAAIAGALMYSALAGFALPTQRAVVMVVVFVASRLLALNGNHWFSFQLAMLLVLLMDPLAATGAGFWLSFTAVAALLLVQSKQRTLGGGEGRGPSALKLIAPQLAVFIGLLVPLGHWQGQVSLLAPMANIIAIPVVSWLVVPASLFASLLAMFSLPASQWLFGLSSLIFGCLTFLLELLVQLPGFSHNWQVSPLSESQLVLAGLGALLMLLPGYAYSRWLALLLMSPLAGMNSKDTNDNAVEVHVLDVGQGLAVVLRTASHTLVYDTGPRFSSGFDSGSAIVQPVLTELGVSRVDLLVVSHSDNDHAGGAAGLLAAMPVDQILTGELQDHLPAPAARCMQGQSWNWDGVDFHFLHPPRDSRLQGNNSSCVLLVSSGSFQLLLPGDIDAGIELLLLQQLQLDESLEVLISAHHGSNTSSSLSFIANLEPQLVIHSAGYRNQFGHPASRVKERIAGLGSAQLETADSGMISVVLAEPETAAEVYRYRDVHKRYWHWSKTARSGR